MSKYFIYFITGQPRGNFFMNFCRLLIFFKILFLEIFFQEYYQSVSLDSDQAQRFVGPGLGPNYLQRLSADGNMRHKVNRCS